MSHGDSTVQGYRAPAGDDSVLVRALLTKKLASKAQIEACQRKCATETKSSLLDTLVESKVLSASQAKMIQKEMSKNNSSSGSQGPQQVPGYQLLEKLGNGSMGAVYKARQISVDRVVALKVLRNRLSRDPLYIERFIQEAKLAAKLAHPNVVQAIDAGEATGRHFFVMEYIEGTTVGQLLKQKGRLGEKESVNIVLQVTKALQHASGKGLVHRDIKPENVMITKDGVVKLADLGLARLSDDSASASNESGWTIGTPNYISPEQARGEFNVDSRADIYSLGATMYHMITGQLPFTGDDPHTVIRKHLHDELTPPDHINRSLSDGIGQVVEMMMAKRREDRYAGPDDLVIDLECLMRGEPPKLAGGRISAAKLDQLVEGEADTSHVETHRDLLNDLSLLRQSCAKSLGKQDPLTRLIDEAVKTQDPRALEVAQAAIEGETDEIKGQIQIEGVSLGRKPDTVPLRVAIGLGVALGVSILINVVLAVVGMGGQ